MTFAHDVARTGLNPDETVLTPANVSAGSFGLLRTLQVDGLVDAQPLYLSQLTVKGEAYNVVFVATENDSVYAFDADGGAVLWQKSLIPAGETVSDAVNCNQVTPTIGVTSTPVIDRNTGRIFLVAMTRDSAGAYHQRLHALDITTGAEVSGSPVVISATYGSKTFEPGAYEERAALLLSGGLIYTSWTSHCDNGSYSGWIISYSQGTLARSSVLNVAASSDSGPAIWMAGNGPAADAAGNVYLLTANGGFDTILDGNGFPSGGDFGNSILRIATAGGMSVADYFSPHDTVSLSDGDYDLGSGGLLLLPDMKDAGGTVRHLLVGGGKTGNVYLADRDSLGRWNVSTDNVHQQMYIGGALFSSPGYFNGTVYFCAVNKTLNAHPIVQAQMAGDSGSTSAATFPYPGCTPAISANGTTNGIVWAHGNSNPAVLYAYDATDLSRELYDSNQAADGRDHFGAGNKFIAPAVVDGRVLVGGTNLVAIFGLR